MSAGALAFALALPPMVAVPLLLAQTGAAQTPPVLETSAIDAAASTITADDVRRRVAILAHDSMRGRELGSRELELTAAYVAHELGQLGIKPQAAGVWTDDTAWSSRYPIPGNLMPSYAGSSLTFITRLRRGSREVISEDGGPVEHRTRVSFADAARFVADTIPESNGVGPWGSKSKLLLLTGRHTAATVSAANVNEEFVVYVPPTGTDSATRQEVVVALKRHSNVVVIHDEDSVAFARARRANEADPPVVINNYIEAVTGNRRWAVSIWPGAVTALFDRLGFDILGMWADSTPKIRSIPSTDVSLAMVPTASAANPGTGMNVIGVLWGTDSTSNPNMPIPLPVNSNFLVISARMDAGGTPKGTANSANDNASGIAGLLALAKAFSQPGARPHRSILFLATTGTTLGAAGANFFVQHQWDMNVLLTVTLDMIGGSPKDSVVIDGLRDFDFEKRPEWEIAKHPELNLTIVDGGSISTKRSDHMAFVARAIPSLLIRGGAHDAPTDMPQAADKLDGIDAELTARRLRLIYYIANSVIRESQWPRWTKEAREQRFDVFGP